MENGNKQIGGSVCFEFGTSARFSQLMSTLSGTSQSSGGYWESRDTLRYIDRGGFEAKLKWLLLRFVFGYNFSNPVVLKGENNINGESKENQLVIANNGNELEFDFSGICYACGITILL